jgi:hypothetical protein
MIGDRGVLLQGELHSEFLKKRKIDAMKFFETSKFRGAEGKL